MSDRILVGSRKGLFTIRRGRESRWAIDRTDFLGDHVSLTGHDPRSGALYAAFQHGHFGAKLHRSNDGGQTWPECGKPVYPEKPADEVDLDPVRGTPIAWNVERVWELVPGTAASPGLLWLGTIPGGLFRSRDGGDSWELVRSLWDMPERKRWAGGGADLPGLHSVCVDPRDDDHLFVAVSTGGVWETTDGARTWTVRGNGLIARYMPPDMQGDPIMQDAHRVVQCRERPGHLWMQHHNGIFRTTDGARTWTEITTATPSTFGFGVVVHPRDPDTAWFVPAHKDEQRLPLDGRLVVTRTRDGGRSFQELRRGLPQVHAYDLTFRHALDIDATGDCLAFGTTTGSLYVSNDGGEAWQCVGEHLPPIDSVRFA
jgi:photosystem II stability/assembly factor-like uncharacterized protein